MKILSSMLLIIISFCLHLFGQDVSYWKFAQPGGTKIYSIFFIDDHKGFAISGRNDCFYTTDKGKTWLLTDEMSQEKYHSSRIYNWSTEIYCSVLHTTDGGVSWIPYANEQQEHFCAVYLKDENTGYKTGCEFLNKVSGKIFAEIDNNGLQSLVEKPQQCTEYYSDENSGWALGWCLKNFSFGKK